VIQFESNQSFVLVGLSYSQKIKKRTVFKKMKTEDK